EVEEYRDGAIIRLHRLALDPHALVDQAPIVAREIVGLQEQEDAPARLVADELRLLRIRRAREQDRRTARRVARRRHQHPALVLRGLILVGDEREVQRADVKVDRLVIIAHDERDMRKRLARHSRRPRSAAPAANGPITVSSRLDAASSFTAPRPEGSSIPAPKISSGTASGSTSSPPIALPPLWFAVSAALSTASEASAGTAMAMPVASVSTRAASCASSADAGRSAISKGSPKPIACAPIFKAAITSSAKPRTAS